MPNVTYRARVKVDSNFPRLDREYDRAIRRGLYQAAEVAASTARAAETRRKSGNLASSIHSRGVKRARRGFWYALVVVGEHYARYQEFGTRGRRTRKVSKRTLARRQSASGAARLARAGGLEGGIRPLRFLGKGRLAARRVLTELVAREMRRVR